ncbi:hypothetical protein [Solidesulfovibrio sp.]|uniref:hypothetical protein n=1 Tax=Solidesulfovibrio sp. TaxID=2910990 RepID=UPI002B201D55|nr:hypothetical protein [Solidesulfovibrio sp.]MEA5087292.1 hypothetical protein [Solidesulfovibrio sp.]
MQRVTSILCVLVLLCVLAGCAGLGASPTSVAELGTADPPTAEVDDTDTAARLESGMEWLWASVANLKNKLAAVATVAPRAAAVAEKALDAARQLVADAQAAANGASTSDALALWTKARAAIGVAAGLVQALAVTSAAGV